MNIFGNFIKDTEIIGVGTLNESKSITCGVNVITFSFRVFCKSSSIIIYSREFDTGALGAQKKWVDEFVIVKRKIAEQIGDVV